MNNTQDFITAIMSEKDGFQLDEPWRINQESLGVVVPVKRDSKEERDYITFAEAKDVKVEDTGSIDSLYLKNNESKPLFISRGEIFRGKTQERAAIHGHIVMPGKGMRVAVRCIHASKGINPGEEMKYGGKAPFSVYSNLGDQMSTWNSVREYSKDAGIGSKGTSSFRSAVRGFYNTDTITTAARSWIDSHTSSSTINTSNVDLENLNFASIDTTTFTASDDLVDCLDNMTKMIKDAMKKMPPIEKQVGAIFLYENEFQGLDVYNLPDSWIAVKEDIVAKEGSSFIKKDDTSIFEFKPEKVKALIGKELGGIFEEKIIYGEKQADDYRIIEIREKVDDKKKKRIIGEAVEFKGKTIHLSLSRV